VRESTRFLLALHGIRAELFASGADFLAGDPERFSFLLVDYQMPESTGIHFLSELRRRGHPTPAALMTASFSPELRNRALSLGAREVFEKPVDEDNLIELIRSVGPGPQRR
jgi:FixJ family two-component response regulator